MSFAPGRNGQARPPDNAIIQCPPTKQWHDPTKAALMRAGLIIFIVAFALGCSGSRYRGRGHMLVVVITGLSGTLVRPRWQEEPPDPCTAVVLVSKTMLSDSLSGSPPPTLWQAVLGVAADDGRGVSPFPRRCRIRSLSCLIRHVDLQCASGRFAMAFGDVGLETDLPIRRALAWGGGDSSPR